MVPPVELLTPRGEDPHPGNRRPERPDDSGLYGLEGFAGAMTTSSGCRRARVRARRPGVASGTTPGRPLPAAVTLAVADLVLVVLAALAARYG